MNVVTTVLKRLKVRKSAHSEKGKSWCTCCKQVTLTEKVTICAICYPNPKIGTETEVCHTCNNCKRCGKQRDVATSGFEIDGDGLGLRDPHYNQPWFI